MRYHILRNFEIDLILDESVKFANTNYPRKVTLRNHAVIVKLLSCMYYLIVVHSN